jgi:hypothetical protein
VYEIILSLTSSKVLSINGPFPAGVPDMSVFRSDDGIMNKIPPERRLIADRGYNGCDEKLSVPNDHDTLRASKFKGRARSRHETFNGRLKEFNILNQSYRHSPKKVDVDTYDDHKTLFESVCILVQYDLKYVPLFEM